jgi:hypothetical protein
MIAGIAIALTLIALVFVLAVRERDLPEPEAVSPVQHLEDRKRAIYENLRDLQFEYRVGKLSDEDYQATKQALQRELAGVLAEMEATLGKLKIMPVRAAAKPAASKKKPAGATVCPFCGAEFQQSLKFCGECGKAIA